jgi:hypothetical protein
VKLYTLIYKRNGEWYGTKQWGKDKEKIMEELEYYLPAEE